MQQHENSTSHKNCVLKLKLRANVLGLIDNQMVIQMDTEAKYWKDVLIRVVAVVKSLCLRGLSFRGAEDKFGSVHGGNFIMSLELIAEFDPFLAKHISDYANKGKGSTSYLSFATFEEFIKLMSKKVFQTIINEIKQEKYFSIVVDSTPDISHCDQLSIIFRYVKENGEPVERFLMFLSNIGHKSKDLADSILKFIDSNGLDIKNCRGQSYDNAMNMSGIYFGLQAQIKKACTYAVYVPCSAHSLNLVGEYAASCCTWANTFFNLIQNIYAFFSVSTHRWNILSTFLKETGNVSIKRLSDTRWSARHDACLSISQNWEEIIKALQKIIEDPSEKTQTKCEARGILKTLNSLEIGILITVWGDILQRFNKINKALQKVTIDLETVISMYNSLIQYINDLRDCFDHYEEIGKTKCGINEYKTTRKNKKIKIGEVDLSSKESFKINTYIVIMDSLLTELKKRKIAYDLVNENFSFFFNLTELSISEVREKAERLRKHYSTDLDSSFPNECIHFRSHLLTLPKEKLPLSIIDMCVSFKKEGFEDIYPYVNIALRMYLCCPVSNCSSERSFSALKRIKSYLRSRMTDERLNSIAILNIESDISKNLDYDDIINEYSSSKARKKM